VSLEPDPERRRPRLLRASAGTGKTYQLVRTYVELVVEEGLRPAQIVAITFTRKATQELRQRIRQSLLASGQEPSLLAEFEVASPVNFHGLCLRLWTELQPQDQAPLLVLGEQGEDQALFVQACEVAWLHTASADAPADLPADGGIEAAVRCLAPYFCIADQLPQDLWSAVARAREEGRAIDAALFARADPSAAWEAAQAAASALQAQLRAELATLEQQGLSKDRALVATLQTFFARLPAADLAPPTWAAQWAGALGRLGRRGRLGKFICKAQQEEVLADLGAVAAEALAATLQPALCRLTEAAWAQYGALKRELGAVDFVDIMERTLARLAADPAARQALCARLQAVLVDEAQDTNPLQRRLIYLLVGLDPQGRPMFDVAQPARRAAQLVVVGDAKQAIYGFRGADPHSFAAFSATVRALGGVQTQLEISRRSVPALIDGINHLGRALFEAAYEPLAPLEAAAAGQPATAQVGMQWIEAGEATNTPAEAGVSTSATSGDARGAQSVDGLGGATSAQLGSDVSAAAEEAQRVVAAVLRHLAGGGRAADVAVLMASMGDAPLFAQALRRQGIDAQISGGGDFFAQPEIVDTLALLRWLVDPSAHLEAACALRSPLFGLSDGLLFWLCRRGPSGSAVRPNLQALREGRLLADGADGADCRQPVGDSVQSGLTAAEVDLLHTVARQLGQLVQAAQQGGAVELLALLDRLVERRTVYQRAARATSQIAVHFDYLAQWAATSDAVSGSVQAFVRRLEARRRQPKALALPQAALAAQREQVTLSSVHQSKGLQYPVVILPGLAKGGQRGAPSVLFAAADGISCRPRRGGEGLPSRSFVAAWAAKEIAKQAELKRLLYVAVTRAERQVLWIAPRLPAGKSYAQLSGQFGAVVGPWAESALAAGCLVKEVLDPPPAPPEPAAPAGTEPAPSLPAAAALPAGCVASFSVTELAASPEPVPASLGALCASRTALTPAPEAVPPASEAMDSGVLIRSKTARVPGAAQPLDGAQRALSRQRRQQGELAHAVLALLGERSCDDPEGFVDAGLASLAPADSGFDLPTLRADLLFFLQSPLGQQVRRLPAGHRRHEMPFVCSHSVPPHRAQLRGQMDLVLWDAGRLVLVDFKYAHRQSHPGSVEPYLRQLDAYAWAAGQLLPMGPTEIETQLVFLRDRSPPLQHLSTLGRQQSNAERLTALGRPAPADP
jgi:ATP-dependent helicase/nuclease subunit A